MFKRVIPSVGGTIRFQFTLRSLKVYGHGSEENGTLWYGTWAARRCANTARMLRSDLKRAGIPYHDDKGRVADFHALRHTFITQLARSGVHPAKAKALARHSTITLTMDVYSHVETDELRGALDMLPADLNALTPRVPCLSPCLAWSGFRCRGALGAAGR